MMIIRVGAGVTVALFVVKGVELQQLNTEQQQKIVHLETEAENLDGKLNEIILESKAKDESYGNEKDALQDKIKEHELELLRQNNMFINLKEKEANLEVANDKMKSKMATLTNEKLSLEEKHDNTQRSIKAKA